MNKHIQSYIDELIRENKNLTFNGAYKLYFDDLDDLTQKQALNFFLQDKDTLDIVKDHIQGLIFERIDRVCDEDHVEAGHKPYQDNNTGEVFWR